MRRLSYVLALLLVGCWGGPLELKAVDRAGSLVPHVVIGPSSGQVPEQGEAIGGGRLTVRAIAADTGARIMGATVAIAGPTPAYATSVASGDAAFQPLTKGTYRVWVSAPGRATMVQPDVPVDPHAPATVTVSLPPGGTLTGTVTDAQGTALPHARVSAGEAVAFADAQGAFTLTGVPLGTQTVIAARTGYAVALRTLTVTSTTAVGALALGAGSRIVTFENAAQSYSASQSVWSALTTARAALSQAGYTVASGAIEVADVRVVVAPGPTAYQDLAAAATRLAAFVTAGGKLVLLAEWGGHEDSSPVVLDTLARPYGIACGGDLVRASAGASDPLAVTLAGPLPGPLTQPLRLYGAASIFATPPSLVLGSTGAQGYRIAGLTTGDWPVIATRAMGRGQVVAIGDTSAFTDAHLSEAGNLAAWLALIGG